MTDSSSQKTKKIKFKNFKSELEICDTSQLDTNQRIEYFKSINKIITDPIEDNLSKAKFVLKNQKKKQKQLHGDLDNLTEFEINKILKVLNEKNTQASFLLALTLFSGQNVIKEPSCIRINWESREFTFSPKIKKNKFKEPIHKILVSVENIIKLPLPAFFDNFQKRKKHDNDIKVLLTEINHELNHKITVRQVANYMAYWLTNQSIDSTEVAMICNQANTISGTNYYLTSHEHLVQVYQSYLIHLSEIVGVEKPRQLSMYFGHIGSNIVVKPIYVSKLFEVLGQKIRKLEIKNFKSLKGYHNVYTIYSLLLLNLASGHRPVNNPYMTLDCFDYDYERVFINDKSSKFSENYRIIILPEIARKQIYLYLNYLQNISNKLKIFDDTFKGFYQQIQSSELPLFNFLTSKFKPIKYQQLTQKLKDIFPVKSNWHRHFMRSQLREYGVDGQIVDLWMGHEGKGGDGFSGFGNCSISDLRSIADIINEMMTDLEISAIEGVCFD